MDAVLQEDDHSARLLMQPLRDLAPEMDTFGRVPAGSLTRLHMDPEGPTPSTGGHVLVDTLPPAAVDAFVAAAGPGSGTSLLAAELRHLGGALARSPRGAGALGHLSGEYAAFFVGIAATPEMGAAVAADASRAVAALTRGAGDGCSRTSPRRAPSCPTRTGAGTGPGCARSRPRSIPTGCWWPTTRCAEPAAAGRPRHARDGPPRSGLARDAQQHERAGDHRQDRAGRSVVASVGTPSSDGCRAPG